MPDPSTSAAALAVQSYFKGIGVDLNATVMKAICGNGSMLKMIV